MKKNDENVVGKITERSSTLMAQYVKAVLDKPKLTKKNSSEYFKQFGLSSNICAYCGNEANTLDHINSVIKDSLFTGYDNSNRNLIPCCQMCNSSKGNKTIEEWLDVSDDKLTKGARRVKSVSGYKQRRAIIDNYIRINDSNKKAFDGIVLEEMKKRAEIFKDIEIKMLKELDNILLKDKEKYNELKDI